MRTAPPLAALLALALAAAAAAAAPVRTFRPAGANLALELPGGWHQTDPDPGWTFQAIGPRFSGWLFLSVRRAVVADGAFQRSLVAFERGQARQLGRHVRLKVARTTVDGEPATQILAVGSGTNAEVIYGFQHAGREYMLVYATTASQFARQRPVFAASARSLRFLDHGP